MSLRMRLVTLSQVEGIMTVSVTGTSARLNMEVPGGGIWHYHVWLCDTTTTSTKLTTTLPTSGSAVEWRGATDENGKAAITIENTGTEHYWIFNGYFMKNNASEIFTLGV